MINAEDLRRALVHAFERPGESRVAQRYNCVAETLRQADMQLLVGRLKNPIESTDLSLSLEDEPDRLLEVARHLDEALELLDHPPTWVRLGMQLPLGDVRRVYDNLAELAEKARAAHRGRGNPVKGYLARALVPRAIEFWQEVVGDDPAPGERARQELFCRTILEHVAGVLEIEPRKATRNLRAALDETLSEMSRTKTVVKRKLP